MQQEFQQHLRDNFPFLYHKKLLIAISGGIDSVVLAHLCKAENLSFALAHCNFQLRGEESDQDEQFVRDLAEKLDVEVYVIHFDTAREVQPGKSIQLAARELRYKWFEQLCKEKKIAHVLVAHHRNDAMETFFINLIRGTGLEGLAGIPEQNNRLLRPLLPFTRTEITDFAKAHHISWREDRSNATDHYLRNRLRHHLIPLLEKERSDFSAQFGMTQKHLRDAGLFIADYVKTIERDLKKEKDNAVYYNSGKLIDLPHPKIALFYLLKDYGFRAWGDIYDLLSAENGKRVEAQDFSLIKDGKNVVLTSKYDKSYGEIQINDEQSVVEFPKGKIFFRKVTEVTKYEKHIAYLADEKLEFPLILRPWKPGDRFQPFGMKGHKKVGDFLKDEKLSYLERKNTWVLLSGDCIVWVVGHRIHNSFRIEENSENILKLQYHI